jgi:hypothetical protein
MSASTSPSPGSGNRNSRIVIDSSLQ